MAKQNSMGRQPSQMQVQAVVQMLNQGQMTAAVNAARQLISSYSSVFYLYDLLGTALSGLAQYEEAVEAYRKAIRLEDKIPDIHFNLAIAQSQAGLREHAAKSYRRVIELNPGFFEAYANLGVLQQESGDLDAAIRSYRKALAIHEDARGHFNLATALRDSGNLDDAIASYQKALTLNGDFADAYNNLGETYRDQGNMDAAIRHYREALKRIPDHAGANYNLAEYHVYAGEYREAIPYFRKSLLDDWQERVLYCLYKTEQFDEFRRGLDGLAGENIPHDKPFLATLSAHYAHNFVQPDPYRFCGDGLDLVYHQRIEEIQPGSELLRQLLHDIETVEIAERKQGRLHHGFQSAGNLFQRPEKSFRTLGELVKREFRRYREHFGDRDWDIIRLFPKDDEMTFTSSWYVKMRQGGHLDRHIHEIGWISGAVYLAMPERQPGTDDAAFEYGIDGDELPRKRDDFPVSTVYPGVGEIVLFPSSLFHRTIPFKADQNRICVAFDLKPVGQGAVARSSY